MQMTLLSYEDLMCLLQSWLFPAGEMLESLFRRLNAVILNKTHDIYTQYR